MARVRIAVCIALLAGAFPGRAAAHAGVTAPAATLYRAEISTIPHGIQAKIVDGDQRLWLSVPPPLTATVIGLRGEPYLRVSSRGVEVNTNSATYFLNRARPVEPPEFGARTAPDWRRISAGDSTSWHEDRLHGLALAAHPSGSLDLGQWIVPLVVNGRSSQITGTLWRARRPSLLWFWPLVLLAACVPALLRLPQAGLEAPAGWLLAGVALAASSVGRLGRELYGRPSISTGQLALVGLTCLVAVGLAVVWFRRDWRTVAGVMIGIVSVYQGLVLIETLRDPFVLAALPAWLERASASLAIASGAGLLFVVVLGVPRQANADDRSMRRLTSSSVGETSGSTMADQQPKQQTESERGADRDHGDDPFVRASLR